MNAFKTLLGVSVLAAAGAANAATVATFNVAETGTSVIYLPGVADLQLIDPAQPHTGVGTATLDSSGSVTIDISSYHLITALGTDSFTSSTFVFPGVPAAGGSETVNSCIEGPNDGTNFTCSSVVLHVANPVDFSTGSVTLAGGSIDIQETNSTSVSTYHFDLTPTAPTVPVPAAAWLFGSGLLGLAGTARRRSA